MCVCTCNVIEDRYGGLDLPNANQLWSDKALLSNHRLTTVSPSTIVKVCLSDIMEQVKATARFILTML